MTSSMATNASTSRRRSHTSLMSGQLTQANQSTIKKMESVRTPELGRISTCTANWKATASATTTNALSSVDSRLRTARISAHRQKSAASATARMFSGAGRMENSFRAAERMRPGSERSLSMLKW